MNLRILKKLSKKAAPMLMVLCTGQRYQHAVTANGDGDCDLVGIDRKHWDRHISAHSESSARREVITAPKCRRGTRFPLVRLWEPMTPMDGTPVIGWLEGYYEPEWEEKTAWAMLVELVASHVTDWVEEDDPDDEWSFGKRHVPVVKRRLRNPTVVLRIASEMIEAKPHG